MENLLIDFKYTDIENYLDFAQPTLPNDSDELQLMLQETHPAASRPSSDPSARAAYHCVRLTSHLCFLYQLPAPQTAFL